MVYLSPLIRRQFHTFLLAINTSETHWKASHRMGLWIQSSKGRLRSCRLTRQAATAASRHWSGGMSEPKCMALVCYLLMDSSYCGWKKSCTTLDGWNMLKPYPPYQGFILLIIEWILYIVINFVIYKLLIYYINNINNLIYPINWVDIIVILLYIINNPSSWWDKPPFSTGAGFCWCIFLRRSASYGREFLYFLSCAPIMS